MENYLLFVPLLAATLILSACHSTLQGTARDTAAALSGALVAAQAQNQESCVPNPNQAICQTINKAIAANNALITATETYCGLVVTAMPNPAATCTPVSSAAAALTAAIANASPFVAEIQQIVAANTTTPETSK
jgi:7-keto-8-aminopelargonate synthetase-like enzyme